MSCEISYRNSRDMDEKLNTFCFLCDAIKHTLGKKNMQGYSVKSIQGKGHSIIVLWLQIK